MSHPRAATFEASPGRQSVAENGRQRRRRAERKTLFIDVTDHIRSLLSESTRITFPCERYKDDPVGFCRDILGIEPWSRQIELLEALRDHSRVACKSGRRVSKSNTAGIAALWWYCTREDARVIMTSTTARQVDQILWREVSMLRYRSGRCVTCKEADPSAVRIPVPCPHSAQIGGEIGELARTGLKPGVEGDFRKVEGFTAREAEAFQGIAGKALLFIADEASGIPQAIFDAINGNRAGGGKLLLTGNPTKNRGEFFDAFHKNRKNPDDPQSLGYYTLTISSEESPNVVAGYDVIPGLATREYILEREAEWGRDSPMFQIHVEGNFAINEEGRIFSVSAITDAQERWNHRDILHRGIEDVNGRRQGGMSLGELQRAYAGLGRLFIGLDPAGEPGTGDDTVFCVRRGVHTWPAIHARGLDDEKHLLRLLELIKLHALAGEVPVVVLDASGSIGASLAGRLRGFAEEHPSAFLLVALRSSDKAGRRPMQYDRLRDELTANFESWLRAGGEIPEDDKLAGEMNEMEWETQINGTSKVTSKKLLKKALGRSPDRYDAWALACWEPLSVLLDEATKDDTPSQDHERADRAFDHYAGLRAFRPQSSLPANDNGITIEVAA